MGQGSIIQKAINEFTEAIEDFKYNAMQSNLVKPALDALKEFKHGRQTEQRLVALLEKWLPNHSAAPATESEPTAVPKSTKFKDLKVVLDNPEILGNQVCTVLIQGYYADPVHDEVLDSLATKGFRLATAEENVGYAIGLLKNEASRSISRVGKKALNIFRNGFIYDQGNDYGPGLHVVDGYIIRWTSDWDHWITPPSGHLYVRGSAEQK